MEYNFREIEKKWQEEWKKSNVYKVSNDSPKPKYYVLDMFPYPSGAGLHVGHPLGYIASDIFARYKRLKGFNVLHPMGYDAFGLPAEQYAVEHGIHPAVSTEQNIKNFRAQLDKIGFCFDWSREVNTSHPEYYKWTQWIFLKLFKSFYNRQTQKAESITQLIETFEKEGNVNHPIPVSGFQLPVTSNQQLATGNQFTAENWNSFDELTQQTILMEYRLAYCGYGEVNWCEALGTVLANDEVVNGVSERGGYPVVKKKLRQWYLRITEYADRLLEGLQTVDFSEAMKEMQSNWIGKSYGAEIDFSVDGQQSTVNLRVYTTRPDTIFGVDFMVIAPEHELISSITTQEQQQAVEEYITYVKSRSDRERQAEKKITGCFTGAFAINPFNKKEIPIWISEYVLAGYGTGAIMGVPCGDERDFKFAKYFNIPITNIIGKNFNGEEANATKDAILENSDFLNDIVMRDAIGIVNNKIEELGIGKKKVNYKMRDAAFSRQRYWGEPFPIIWTNGVAYPLDENELPLILPEVEKYGPGPDGEGPLANLKDWVQVPSPPNPLHAVDKGAVVASGIPKYKVITPMQYELAKEMRKNHTEAEEKLWDVLRNEKLGVKFRRQHPIEAYIVDFICLQEKLIVEVDRGYHENEEQKLYDENRTKALNDIGFEVIRFTNEEVLHNINVVKNKIKQHIASKKQTNIAAATDTINREDAHSSLHPWRGARGEGVRETNTMPGYAGSSWYFLRYMDPHNNNEFCSRKASDYWGQVDLYIGGTEHAVGHLLYSRMWTKALHDLNFIGHDEPYRKLVNQGMIVGQSFFTFVDFEARQVYSNHLNPIGVNIKRIRIPYAERFFEAFGDLDFGKKDNFLAAINCEGFNLIYKKTDADDYDSFDFEMEIEKMSKSKFNTVNPDHIIINYGADTFRMYEMFLGPVEQSKPWDTKGIEGVHRFLKKLWRLFYDEMKGKVWNEEKANDPELKVLHKTIKKIEEDTERFSFNTAVSAAMIAVNEFSDLKCNKKEILEPLLILLTPYSPHICEELWHLIGNAGTILDAAYPKAEEKYLKESTKNYPIAFNGRTRAELNISLDATQQQVEEIILSNEALKKWFEGKQPKKIIYVKNKMINVVV
jgi:leucyl-tRNA synthetase/very-short-patch-repair endonuclease